MMGNAELEESRLVLVGNTGSGKSSSGNTILGQKKFLAKLSGSSVTRKCQSGSTDRAFDDDQKRMRKITVVDMPGFGDTHLSMEEIYTEMAKCLYHAAPGPHAFLLVVPIERYTDYQAQAVNHLAKIFGDDAVKSHTIVLFTKGDSLEGMEFDEYLKESPDGLRELINKCGGRYHVFNNEENYGNATQVQELMMKVDKMAKKSETEFYTSAMFKEAEAAIRKEQKSECNGCNGALTQKVSLSSKLMGILKRIVANGAVGLAIGLAFGVVVVGTVCAAVAALGIGTAAVEVIASGISVIASGVVEAVNAGAGAGTLAAATATEVVQNTVKVATAVSAVAKAVKDKTKDSQKSYNK